MPQIGVDLKDIAKITPRRKGVASHPKGKAGEYAIIKIFDKYSEAKWIRIPNSGAQLGQSNRTRINQLHESQIEALLGDIFPPGDLQYRFIIESKNYGTFPFKKFEAGNVPSQLKIWLEQMQHDCVTYLMTPAKRKHIGLLFVKITKMGEWLVFNKQYLTNLLQINIPKKHKQFVQVPPQLLIDNGYGDEWIWCDADELCLLNKSKLFIKNL